MSDNANVLTYGKALVGDLQGTGKGEHVLQSVDVTVTSAELLALNATPKTLVAAPGSGKANVFEGAVAFYDYGTGAYAAVAAGDDFAVKYTDGSGLQVASCEATGFIDQTSDQTRFIHPYRAASGASDITPVANAALVLQMLNSEVTTGDGIVKLRVYFRVVPTTL